MTSIRLTTVIYAPIELVFNVSRNLDIHKESVSQTNEKIIAGRKSGLIELNETVTWKGRHFGIYLTHKSRITAMDFPMYFTDEMEEGCFKSFRHDHCFEQRDGMTLMRDNIDYETPFGIFGRFFDKLLLKKYLTDLIIHRNQKLKTLSEQHQQGPPENGNGLYPEGGVIP